MRLGTSVRSVTSQVPAAQQRPDQAVRYILAAWRNFVKLTACRFAPGMVSDELVDVWSSWCMTGETSWLSCFAWCAWCDQGSLPFSGTYRSLLRERCPTLCESWINCAPAIDARFRISISKDVLTQMSQVMEPRMLLKTDQNCGPKDRNFGAAA